MKNLLLLKRLYRQNAVEPFSEKELKRLYEAFVETRLIASVRIKKSYEDFVKVSDEILKLNETVRAEFVKIMENWEPNPMAKLPPFDQFRFESNTAYFRAVSRDNLRQYQSEGVEKVQIVAYIDDRTSPTCLDMHGRVFNISGYEDKLGQNTSTPNPDEMLGYAGRPTTDITTILPPYHFNCRTTFIAYEEPKTLSGQAKDLLLNHEKITADVVKPLLKEALKAKWSSLAKRKEHSKRHGIKEMQLSNIQYNQNITDNIRRAGRDITLVVDEKSQNLLMYFYRYNHTNKQGINKFLLTVIDLSNNNIVTHFVTNLAGINKKLDAALRSSKDKGRKTIMKAGRTPKFKISDPIDDDEKVNYIEDYVSWFFHPSMEFQWDFDMEQRYSLYLLEMKGGLTAEEIKILKEQDKKYYNNYCNGKYKIPFKMDDEIADFFEWLGEVIERWLNGG